MSMITNLTNCGWEELTQILAGILYPMGFDLVKAFPAERYNSNIPSMSTLVPLPITNFRGSTSVQRNRSSTLSVIIGNTRHLWSIFIDYYAKNMRENIGDNQENGSEESDTYKQSNPLDWYTRISIESAVKRAVSKFSKNASTLEYEIRYAFDLSEDRFVAFQQLAQDAGLAYYNKICYLSVHPEYGPWIGLRAVVTFDIDGPPNTSKLFPTPGNPYPKGDQLLETKMEEVLKNDNGSQSSSTNVTNIDKESVAKTNFDKQVIANISRDWYKWVKLRDIAGGFMSDEMKLKYRYSIEQLEYHYTKNLKLLITIQVGQGGLKFVPQNITVNIGDVLTFNWANGGPHSVVQSDGPAGSCTKSSRAGAFNSGQKLSGTFDYTVKTSGDIFYFCDVPGHCEEGGMWGVITVGSSSGNSSSTGATSTKSSASSTSTTIVTLLGVYDGRNDLQINNHMILSPTVSDSSTSTGGVHSTSEPISSAPTQSVTISASLLLILLSSVTMAAFLMPSLTCV
ncbi:2277_t:CDS:2 [Acaulospora morrowiae]|uniref:2277_t:CDS:1 n=1 Tax=Acaulospora morrowiae TaxID=94023 RepID=A0A9N9CNK9_9GLOM|nr:2277_t:CDS:2 [Acaulospora morrowiae]